MRRPRNPVILVVGSEETRAAVRSMLEGQLYLVAACRCGADAIKYAARMKPAFLLTDVELVDMTGRELLAQLARISPSTRTIVMGGGFRQKPESHRRRRAHGHGGE